MHRTAATITPLAAAAAAITATGFLAGAAGAQAAAAPSAVAGHSASAVSHPAARSRPAAPPKTTAAGQARTVSYLGFQLHVPASWPVYDLTKAPSTCVRVDVHAVYLGHPGSAQNCPAHLVGRSSAVLLQPADAAARAGIQAASAARDDGTVQRFSGNGKVLITATAPSASAASSLLAGTTLDATPPAAPAVPRVITGSGPGSTGVTPATTGSVASGFDVCAAPSTSTMGAWRSAYGAVGVYIGGINRACDYGNLTSDWVSSVHNMGYQFIATYVGPQAPCSGIGIEMPRGSAAAAQAQQNALGAVLDMQALGIDRGSAVYLDIEDYNPYQCDASASVQTYIAAWTAELHQLGYVSGFYSSTLSDVRAMWENGTPGRPDAVWMARWDNRDTVFGNPALPDSEWPSHQRLHQYTGGTVETHGGVTMNVDKDATDGPLAPGSVRMPSNMESLGGGASSGPSAYSRAPGTMVTVERFSDNAVRMNYIRDGSWAGWSPVGYASVAFNPAVAVTGPASAQVFATSTAKNLLWAPQTDGQFGPWQNLGGCVSGSPDATATLGGGMAVVVQGCNQGHTWLNVFNGRSWSGFSDLGGSSAFHPTIVRWLGHLEVFIRATNGTLMHDWQLSNGSWSGWQGLGGSVASSPAAIAFAPYSMDVVARTVTGSLQLWTYRGSWDGPRPLTGPSGTSDSDPAVTSYDGSRIDIFYQRSGSLIHEWNPAR